MKNINREKNRSMKKRIRNKWNRKKKETEDYKQLIER